MLEEEEDILVEVENEINIRMFFLYFFLRMSFPISNNFRMSFTKSILFRKSLSLSLSFSISLSIKITVWGTLVRSEVCFCVFLLGVIDLASASVFHDF